MSPRWYYETVSADGRWMPNLSETRPGTIMHGGHMRLQMATGGGTGPRIRALAEIHPDLSETPIAQLHALLSPDLRGVAVSQLSKGVH